MQVLLLSKNKIKDWPGEVLRLLPKLTCVRLDSNPLRQVKFTVHLVFGLFPCFTSYANFSPLSLVVFPSMFLSCNACTLLLDSNERL